MNLKSVVPLGILPLMLSSMTVPAASAQTVSVPAPESPSQPIDIRLNARQREAIAQISEFAFDQFETILDGGLNPETWKRPDSRQAEQMLRQLPDLMRPDQQQMDQFRTLLRSARQQVEQQVRRSVGESLR